MEPFSTKATLLATLMASLLALRAHRRKSLTPAGGVAAFAVGFLLIGAGLRGFNLLVFYFVAMQATKYKKDYKATIDGTIASNQGSTMRGVGQVLACSLLATLLSLWHAMYCGAERPIDFTSDDSTTTDNLLASQLTCAIIAHHATCLADTLASELGILNKSPPFLITQPWKRVPTGTNGGVSLLGFVWSTLGGAMIGMSTIIFELISGILVSTDSSGSNSALEQATRIMVFSTCCGLLGSILDSLLGATLQRSYFDADTKMVYQEEDDKRPEKAKLVAGVNILTNELVNVVSVALTCVLGGWAVGPLVFAP